MNSFELSRTTSLLVIPDHNSEFKNIDLARTQDSNLTQKLKRKFLTNRKLEDKTKGSEGLWRDIPSQPEDKVTRIKTIA